ncbi:MAG: hypothetical protein GC137_05885 [Alphaproteobacteria bacterium]|nr:hypothetical protein [Alphaproteobacteria bacterium]
MSERELSGRDEARKGHILSLMQKAIARNGEEAVIAAAQKAIKSDAGAKMRASFDLETVAGITDYVNARIATTDKGANKNLRAAFRAMVPQEARAHGNKYRPEGQQHASL